MSGINVAGEIDKIIVWDDPEYCETGSGDLEDKCDFLQYHDGDDNHRCYLYPFEHEPVVLEMNWQTMQFKKCNQCKKAWKKSKDANDPVKIQERIDDDFFDSEYA